MKKRATGKRQPAIGKKRRVHGSTNSRVHGSTSPRFPTKTYIPPAITRVLLVGCGGTGSILAEHLARLAAGFRLAIELVLMDGDTVSEANIARQNFLPHEIRSPKAQALALRLSGQFGLEIAAVVKHLDDHTDVVGTGCLLITCTDTLVSRKWAAQSQADLWLDAGNELAHGQAVLGSTHQAGFLGQAWREWDKHPHAHALPDMAALSPAILAAKTDLSAPSCADQPFGIQGFAVNSLAALAAAVIAKAVLVDKRVACPQMYFDVARGFLRPRPITRELFQPWRNAAGKKATA